MKQLSLIEKAFFLKQTTLCQSLDFDLVIALADKLHQDFYEKGEKIFEINQNGSRLYFISFGKVELLDKDGKPFITLGETQFFGDEAIFNEMPRAYSASSLEKSQLLTLSKTNLTNLISECPTVATALLQAYAQTTHCRYDNKH